MLLQVILGYSSEYVTIHKPMHTSHQQFSLSLLHSAYQNDKNTHLCPYAIETMLKGLSFGSYKITYYELKNILKNHLQPDEIQEFHYDTMHSLAIALFKGDYVQKQALYISSGISIDQNFLNSNSKLCGYDLIYEEQNKSEGIKIQEWLFNKFKKTFYKFPELKQKETKGKISPITYVDYCFNWQQPFDPIVTSIDSFQYSSNIKVQGIVDMMEQVIDTDYFEDESLQAIELPLENHLACLILLPKQEQMGKLIDLIEKPIYLKKIVSKMKKTVVDIKLPKIRLDTPVFYKEALLKMGLSQPFMKLADFRGIDANHALSLDQAILISKISFSEGGINSENIQKHKKPGLLKSNVSMIVNHSFLYLIVDNRDLTIYDCGVYQSPF